MIRPELRLSAVLAVFALTGCIEESDEPTAEPGDAAVMADAAVTPDAAPDAMVEPDAMAPPPPPSCGNEDDLFPNDTLARATPIEAGFSRNDLFLCPERSDWFAVLVTAGQRVSLSLLADPPEADLDLVLTDAEGAVLDVSAGETGEERIDVDAAETGTVYAQVVGAYPDQAAFYAFSVQSGCVIDAQCPENTICDRGEGACVPFVVPDCGADVHEPNDRDDQAAALAGRVEGTVCEGDRDWFGFEAARGDGFDLLVAGAVDAFVVDRQTGGVLLATDGEAQTTSERLRLDHLPAGQYGVVVVGSDGPRDVNFALELAGRSGACQADRDCRTRAFPICGDDGVCAAPDTTQALPLGAPCTADEQCGADADLCYTGNEGGHDNVCTVRCSNDAQCEAALGGGVCTVIDRQGTQVCFPPCASDDDCSAFRTCQNNTCELRGTCQSDRQCGEGETCQTIPPFGRYCGLPGPQAQCGADPEAYTPNDRQAEAAAIPADGSVIEGLAICDDDQDWFEFEVPAEAAAFTLEVAVAFREGVDIDVYVFDANGSPVAEATSPDRATEVATARWIAPGTYSVYVDQFSSDALADTAYTISASLIDNGDACTVAGNECGGTEPLRTVCDEATGSCNPIFGEGQVPLGSACDSDDDCGPGAEVCWVFEGGQRGFNICTHSCRGAADCADVPGTVCTPFQGFAACLPPR